MDDYGWFLQRTRNLLDLGNADRYYIDFSTLSIWFENEADAVAYRNRVAMIGTSTMTVNDPVRSGPGGLR